MTAATRPARLITAEEFLHDHAEDCKDLLDGRPIPRSFTSLRHGQLCSTVLRIIGNFVEHRRLGHAMSNTPHILIHRDPDRMRGPDLCFISFERLPPGLPREGVSELVPELTVEIRSPSNTWSDIFGKVGDYLKIGVTAVLVLDPDTKTASVYRMDVLQQILTSEQELTLPDVLPGFAVAVGKFFE